MTNKIKKDSLKESFRTKKKSVTTKLKALCTKKNVLIGWKIIRYSEVIINPSKRGKLVMYVGLDILISSRKKKKKLVN